MLYRYSILTLSVPWHSGQSLRSSLIQSQDVSAQAAIDVVAAMVRICLIVIVLLRSELIPCYFLRGWLNTVSSGLNCHGLT